MSRSNKSRSRQNPPANGGETQGTSGAADEAGDVNIGANAEVDAEVQGNEGEAPGGDGTDDESETASQDGGDNPPSPPEPPEPNPSAADKGENGARRIRNDVLKGKKFNIGNGEIVNVDGEGVFEVEAAVAERLLAIPGFEEV